MLSHFAGIQAFPDNQIAEALVDCLEQKQETHCADHNQPLILFCDNAECQIPICALCIPKKHPQHNVVELDSKVEAGQAKLKRALTTAEKLQKEFSEYSTELDTRCFQIREKADVAKAAINFREQNLHEELRLFCERLRRQVDQESEAERQRLIKEYNSVETNIRKIISFQEHLKRATSPTSVFQEIVTANKFLKEMDEVQKSIEVKDSSTKRFDTSNGPYFESTPVENFLGLLYEEKEKIKAPNVKVDLEEPLVPTETPQETAEVQVCGLESN